MTIIIILFLFSQVKLSVHNIKDINYVKLRFFMFTVDLDYSRFMKTLKKFSVKNNYDLQEQIKLYITLNPLFKDIAKQTVIKRANFYKYFIDYDQTYEIITYYLLSSYLNSALNFNCKRLKNYSYDVVFSNKRVDMDFDFVCNITIGNLSYALLKNIKMLFKYIKNKGDKKNGS
jgi:hypothetical protein